MCDDFSKVFVTTVENHSCAKQASVFEESSSITAPPLVNAGVAAGDIDDDASLQRNGLLAMNCSDARSTGGYSEGTLCKLFMNGIQLITKYVTCSLLKG